MTKRFFLSVLTIGLMSIVATAQDIAGSQDHALISRYPGSVIQYYEEQNFASYHIATGPQTGYKTIDDWASAEGRLTRIYYSKAGETTVTEIFRNYLSALSKGGFKILAQGIDDKRNVSKAIGGRSFINTFYERNPFPPGKGIRLLQGSATVGGSAYLAAHLKKADTELYVVVSISQHKSDEKVLMLDVLETAIMEDDLIKVNADEMMKGIRANGKIALYGIFFDTDKAILKPTSKPMLDEIANLLKQNAALQLYVVGHSDLQGELSYNIELSEKRARAVVEELVGNYQIAASRLVPKGVGPLVPVSTNVDEKGRKQNRRVELVER